MTEMTKGATTPGIRIGLRVPDVSAASEFYQGLGFGDVGSILAPTDSRCCGSSCATASSSSSTPWVPFADSERERQTQRGPRGLGVAIGLQVDIHTRGHPRCTARRQAARSPPQPMDMPWGDRLFECVDPFGYMWEMYRPLDGEQPADGLGGDGRGAWFGSSGVNMDRFSGFADLYDAQSTQRAGASGAAARRRTRRGVAGRGRPGQRHRPVVALGGRVGRHGRRHRAERRHAAHRRVAAGTLGSATARASLDRTGLGGQVADVVLAVQAMHWMEPVSTGRGRPAPAPGRRVRDRRCRLATSGGRDRCGARRGDVASAGSGCSRRGRHAARRATSCGVRSRTMIRRWPTRTFRPASEPGDAGRRALVVEAPAPRAHRASGLLRLRPRVVFDEPDRGRTAERNGSSC